MVASADTVAMLMYSARKNIANFIDEYSVWKPADQLALGLGQVERRPVGLADHRDHVDHERREQQDAYQPGARCQSEQVHGLVRLRRDDLRGGHRAGEQEDRHQRQAHRDLVGDHLRGGPQAAEQRVRRAGRPAAEHDAVDADEATASMYSTATGRSVSCSGVWCRRTGSLTVGPNGMTAKAGSAGIADDHRRQDVDEPCRRPSGSGLP